jgi:hypothetical protein
MSEDEAVYDYLESGVQERCEVCDREAFAAGGLHSLELDKRFSPFPNEYISVVVCGRCEADGHADIMRLFEERVEDVRQILKEEAEE